MTRKTDDATPPAPDLSWKSATAALTAVAARDAGRGGRGIYSRWKADPAGHAVTALATVLILAVFVLAQSARASVPASADVGPPALTRAAEMRATAVAVDTPEPTPGAQTGQALPAWLPASVTRWAPNIVAASERHGIPPALQGIVVLVESCGLATAGSSAGAQGLGQVVARYHPRILEGAGPFDPDHNLDVSAEYLAALWKRYAGDVDKVAASYNGGNPGNINPETNRYRRWVSGMWRDRDTADGGPMFAEWMAAVRATPGNLCERAERAEA